MSINAVINPTSHGHLNSYSGIKIPTQKDMALPESAVKDVFYLGKTLAQGNF
jgi:hypothetical protein